MINRPAYFWPGFTETGSGPRLSLNSDPDSDKGFLTMKNFFIYSLYSICLLKPPTKKIQAKGESSSPTENSANVKFVSGSADLFEYVSNLGFYTGYETLVIVQTF